MTDEAIKKSLRFRFDKRMIQSGECCEWAELGFMLFRQGHTVGVAIPTGETFYNIHNIHPAKSFTMDSAQNILDKQGNFLTLTTSLNAIDFQDSVLLNRIIDTFCQFVRLEDNNRNELLADPKAWAKKMIEYWGNSAENDLTYAYIAELNAVRRLYEAGLMTDIKKEYRGPEKNVHDIELPDCSIEIKAHLYGDMSDKANTLTVSSEFQLEQAAGKKLYVVYYRMEDTGDLSLQKEVDALVASGVSKVDILEKLKKSKHMEGDLFWDLEYHTQNEPQVYQVTEDFPRITPSMFADGHFPTGIVKMVYTISLANIPSCGLSEFIAARKEGREPKFFANFNPGVK